ncbi:MAG: TIGR00269 family protein [Candidatus Woesearchaeota archaeon]|jgi:uncharacterized protein (TIGR00269 family)
MKCFKCERKAVIELQNGPYCKEHFFYQLEEKITKTIKKYHLIDIEDKVCVATSGGKDSLTVLYFTNLFCKERNIPIFALMIDEGILGYRNKTKEDLELFCKNFDIELHTASFKEVFGKTLDELSPVAYEKFGKKPCTICGVFRRVLLNVYARKLGATKLVTGHNQDDESQAFIMNVIQGHQKQNAALGPMAGLNDNEKYVRRIKPLYFVSEKESRVFCLLKNFKVDFAECPYITQSYRADIRDAINTLEEKYPATKSGIIKSFLEIMPELKQKYNSSNNNPDNSVKDNPNNKFKYCERCNEPCSGDVCNACKIIEELDCTPISKEILESKKSKQHKHT